MARRSMRSPRCRLLAGAAGLALAATTAGGVLALSSSSLAGADASSTGARPDEQVIVCESGVVSTGDTDTSSAVVVRVPAGTPVPAGCSSR